MPPRTKAANNCPPNRSCSFGSSRISVPNTTDTNSANTIINPTCDVFMSAGAWREASFAALRDVERVEHHEHVHQSGDDQECVAVLVAQGDDASGTRAGLPRDEKRNADAHVGERRQRD